jgi:hypothetical protein
MASLKLFLGLIPSTSKIEQAEKALTAEFEKLKGFASSAQLARYLELDKLITSNEFTFKKKEIESLRFKNSEEHELEKEYYSLQKAKDIVQYFKTSGGSDLKRFRDLDGSEKIKGFEKLEWFISTPEFREKQKMRPVTFKDTDEYNKFQEYKILRKDREIKAYLKPKRKEQPARTKLVEEFEKLEAFIKSPAFLSKKNMKPVTFKDTEEFQKLQEYKRQKGSAEIKAFYTFKEGKEYANYLNVNDSKRLDRYNELKGYVASKEFIEKKNYLLDKKRFEKTEMFSQLNEYEKLKKNEDILWYFKVKDSDKFDVLKHRELTFNDEFESDRIDTSKWITNYYWGDKLLKDRFSVESDLHIYTEKDNFELRNSILKISTRPQRVNGKAWSADKGFTTKEFGYTSGIITSGGSFRQKYGIFSAKLRLGNPESRSAFWLLSEAVTPHIDICRTGKGKVWCDIFANKSSHLKASVGSRYANDWFIFTLEWTPNSLTWLINDTEVFVQTSNVPQEPMYISLAGGLDKPVNGSTSMDIDWVRVYRAI